MRLHVEITDEDKDKIFSEDMQWHIENFKETLEVMKETKNGSGYVSWDYKEDKKAVKEMIKSLEQVYDYYGGNI